MNKILYIFILVSILCSCDLKKKNKRAQECNKNFSIFFEEFGSDSNFQKRHVKFPLRYLISDYDYEQEKDTFGLELIEEKDNRFIDFSNDKDAINNEYEKYTIKKEKKNDKTIFYKRLGYDNGIRVAYKFKLIDGCWYLVEIIDESS